MKQVLIRTTYVTTLNLKNDIVMIALTNHHFLYSLRKKRILMQQMAAITL